MSLSTDLAIDKRGANYLISKPNHIQATRFALNEGHLPKWPIWKQRRVA